MSEMNLTKIKFAAVEIITKDSTKKADITSGLFLGVWRNTSSSGQKQKFFVVMDSDTSVRLFNVDYFNLLTLQVMDGDSEYMTIFKNTEDEQEKGIAMLEGIVGVLKDDKKLMSTDMTGQLIDPDHYTEYSEAVLKNDDLTDSITGKSTKPATTNTASKTGAAKKTNGTGYTVGRTQTNNYSTGYDDDDDLYGYGHGCGGYHGYGGAYRAKPKPKPKATLITRKGKLPVVKIGKMLEKIRALAAGDYKVKPIPIVPADVVEAEAEDKKTGTKNLPVIV